MQQKPTSHASKSYGQPMFVRLTNQGGQDGATLIARQGRLGPGSWTLLRLGGQFNSRRPFPLGSLWEQREQGAGSREGSTSIVGQLYHYLMRLPSYQPFPPPRRGFGFGFILTQAFSCCEPSPNADRARPSSCDCVKAEGEQTSVCYHIHLACKWLAGPTRCG